MECFFKLNHVSKAFHTTNLGFLLEAEDEDSHKVKAVNDVSLSINKGEFIGLVGKTGCGKSTVARLAVRLIQPDTGSVIFNNENIFELKKDSLSSFRRQVRMLFQDPSASLNPKMTVGQIVEEPVKLYTTLSKKERRDKVFYLLEEVSLSSYFNKFPGELSGGEKRRISLARGLSMDPKLVIADEVSSGLDSSTKQQIMNILDYRNREMNMAILLISHDLKLVRQWCRRIEVMEEGYIVESIPSGKEIEKYAQHPCTRELIDAILEV